MSEVVIAPAALLGKIGRERNDHPINSTNHLPLGNETAEIVDRLGDDYKTTEYKFPTIADAKERNKETNEQKNTLVEMAQVGKVSEGEAKHVHDLSAVNTVSRNINDKMTLDEFRHEKESQFNLVATPFVQAEPIFPEIENT